MDRYGGPHTALIIALYGGLYFAFIKEGFEGPNCPYYRLAWRILL
jgi:hypothetical protein